MFTLTNAGISAGDVKLIIVMFFLIAVLTAFVALMLSVVNALGIYEMTKTLGIKSKWFAFFPFFRSVAVGKLSDCAKGKANTFFRKTLLILNILYAALFLIGACGFFMGFADTVFEADKIITADGTVTADILSPLIVPAVIIGIGCAVFLIYKLFYYISLFRIFSAFVSQYAVLYTVLSVLFPILPPIFLFFIRKNKPVFPRREGYNYFTEG